MLAAFPAAPVYTALYNPDRTFPEFMRTDVRTLPLNRLRALREDHRKALPFLAASYSRLKLESEVVLCSSSGWSHGANATHGRKVVYWHSPAKWLYQSGRYGGGGRRLGRLAVRAGRRPLMRWDERAVATVDRHLANSTFVRDQLRHVYGIEAAMLPAPHSLGVDGGRRPIPGIELPYMLCVSRLIPYKNVGAVVRAFRELAHFRLVVVGAGPLEAELRASAPANVRFLGRVTDDQLRWLYAHCTGVLAASYEDYGLTPLEGAAFGRPSAALRWGGFLDTVVSGRTGVFFDQPTAGEIAQAVNRLTASSWEPDTIRAHAEGFSEAVFVAAIRRVVQQEIDAGAGGGDST